jgi:hypothetical protein
VCEHDYQDSKYGKSKRVFNQTRKDSGKGYRCTVCGKEQSSGDGKDGNDKGAKK